MSSLPMSIAAEDLFGEYDQLVRFFSKRVESSQEAKDLTQETFARFIRARETSEVRLPRGLLYRIAHNLLIDRSRRRKIETGSSLPGWAAAGDSTDIDPSRVIAAREECEIMRRAIADLPERTRAVFVLSRFGGLSYPEIATQLSISVSTVEKHVIYALLACRAALKGEKA